MSKEQMKKYISPTRAQVFMNAHVIVTVLSLQFFSVTKSMRSLKSTVEYFVLFIKLIYPGQCIWFKVYKFYHT